MIVSTLSADRLNGMFTVLCFRDSSVPDRRNSLVVSQDGGSAGMTLSQTGSASSGAYSLTVITGAGGQQQHHSHTVDLTEDAFGNDDSSSDTDSVIAQAE